MIKVKILYDLSEIDDLELFKNHIKKLQEEYNNSITLEETNEKKIKLFINDKIVFTTDDNFSIEPIKTSTLLKKIDHQIYSAMSLKRSKQDSKFDDIGLIDF